ncbi:MULTISPECIES: DUF6716 putative glycosyltransferase [Aphanothece]|uniref:DUF6716 putative glycosyltransferase n=1 Tax=Aphanothece TaxID=1121 RepID=UPI003985072B
MTAVLLIADSDSQLLYCEALARTKAATGIELTINLIPRDGTPKAVIQRMRRLGTVQERSMAALLRDSQLNRYAGIGVFLTGSKLAEFRSAYHQSRHQQAPPRALLFCGFNGVVLERFEEAITWRLGYDLICLNGPRDQVRFERFLRHTPFQSQRTLLTGLGRSHVAQTKPLSSRPRRLVFAEQVALPALPQERQEMVRHLVALARRCPDWQIVLKPRVAPHEATFHEIGEHISTTLERLCPRRPPNLTVSYEALPALLAESRLFATLSSTAFFDALDHGCIPLVMGDFGVRADLGTVFFGGSGMLVELGQIQDLEALLGLRVNPDWLEWVGYGSTYTPAELFVILRRHGAGRAGSDGTSPSLQPRDQPPRLQQRGYVVNSGELSTNQLRVGAEQAIDERDYGEAAKLLEMAALQRPDNANIRRRLVAVRAGNRLVRRLLLLATPRFKL